ncbi:hypothetical protein PLEOSDRAFT_1102462 [Pleurotus ostreatus PC15]|uniref:F-box domain-containing protein n=1 Tax=Pleurotus ostreatus (strain PC15) TaxID=1137138 RepID=A0A067NTT9_PLEO1|nr:hypothetical protein PLEOSDRAFT_1102462 [Pleurotus ostreatus PC15]
MISTHSQELEDLYDAKINAHFADIRLLREQRNADCSKTRNLPPEILSTIFGILHSEITQYSYQEWIVVTHVCRTWRNIALDDPSLWSDITVVPTNWIPEAFARSKAAPLTLGQGGFYDRGKTLDFIYKHVAEHPERIKRLYIHGEEDFINTLTKPAPFLEHVDISPDMEFPPDFLGGVAPRLKSVSCQSLPLEATWLANLTRLECFQVHLGAVYMSNLISLELGYDWVALDAAGGVIHCVDIDLLLSALQNMPLLQQLCLTLPRNMSNAPSNRSAPIHHHHLRDITVHLRKPKSAVIFNHLRVDSIERLEITCPIDFKDTAMIDPVCRFFNMCYHGSNLSYYLLQDGRDLEMHQFVGSIHTPVLLFKCLRPTDLVSVVNLLPRCVPRILAMHRKLPPKFPLADCDTIEELQLHIISEYSTSAFFEFLEAPSISYPSLRQLRLEGVSFVPKAKRIPPLKRWISKRKSGTKLELLVLKDCGLSDKDIASLRKVVTVVG